MLKKLIACFALCASMSFAAWDNIPILPQGSGQAAAQFGYTSQKPLSGIILNAGVRYSPLSWLELSAIIPYGFYTLDTQYGDKDFNGILNSRLGLRFQVSQGFSLFFDLHFPGNSDLASDEFAPEFGLQHSNLFTHVTWAKYVGYMLGDAWSNRYLYFGTELQVSISQFVIYGELRFLIGQENHLSYYGSGHSDEGGNNGMMASLGLKFNITEQLTVDAHIEIGAGDRFTRKGYEEPFGIGVAFLYKF